jgi:hypothetical protein
MRIKLFEKQAISKGSFIILLGRQYFGTLNFDKKFFEK